MLFIKKYDKKFDKLIETENKDNKNNEQDKKEKENYKNNIKAVIKNKRLWILIVILTLTPFTVIFSRNTFRVYGALVSMSGAVMQYSQLFIGVSNVVILPIWGIINDKYKYKIIFKIIGIGYIIQSALLSLFINSNLIYLLSIILGSVFSAGFTSMMNLHLLKVFGIKYIIEIGGIIGIFSSVFNILIGILSFVISKFYHTGEELQYAYRYVYLFGLAFCCLGYFFGLKENDEKFIYPFDTVNNKDDEEFTEIINSDDNDKSPKEIELETTSDVESNKETENELNK